MIRDAMAVFLRDLDGLCGEIALYPDDASLWVAVPGQPNAGGNLALHLAGNLRHFVGAILGHTGYVRDRDAEFTTRDLSRADVLSLVAAARAEVERSLTALDDSDLDQAFPTVLAGRQLTIGLALLHLIAHLTYHLGQIDYHRRAVTGSTVSAGAVSLAVLGTSAPS